MVAVDLKLSLSSGNTSGLDPASHDGTSVHSSWNRLGKSVVMNNERIGVSSDFWNNYAQDIRLAKELGVPVTCFLNPCSHVTFYVCLFNVLVCLFNVTFETDCARIAFASVPPGCFAHNCAPHNESCSCVWELLLLNMLTVASVSHSYVQLICLSAPKGQEQDASSCLIPV